MKIPVIVYQMDIHYGKPELNLKKISEMLEKEQPQKESLLLLPELFLTGYHKSSIDELTEIDHSNEFKEVLDISRKYSIYIFGSIPMRHEDQIYNTAIFVHKGEVIGKYNKSHLFGPMGEKKLFSVGRKNTVFNIENLKIGLSICYDLRFPELYQQQMQNGANLLLICAEWPSTRISHWISLLKARAIENQLTIIACNRVGSDPDYNYGGHSMIVNSFGDIIEIADNENETLLKFVIDSEKLSEFRKKFSTVEDRWINQ